MKCRQFFFTFILTTLVLNTACSRETGPEAIPSTEPETGRDMASESPFGFHPGMVSKMGYTDNGYTDAQNIGVAWTREGLYALWFMVQPDISKPTYTFVTYDKQWSKVPADMRILGNIAPQGPIDEKDVNGVHYCLANSYMPSDTDKYVAFVKTMVERYDGDGIDDMPGLTNPIKYWQVGNEPNGLKNGFADLQKITYAAIKQACPDCQVLIGGVPGMPPVNVYVSNFDTTFKPILDSLGGQYVDILDFHWYGAATGDYKGVKEVYDHIRSLLQNDGFPEIPIWITEMGAYSGDPAPSGQLAGGVDFPAQTERQQALDYLKRFVYSLSFGIKKIFPAFGLMEGFKHDDSYFDHTGLIYDGQDGSDAGLGVKKLGYYTYKKMTEMLEGSDWNSIETIRESDDVYIYKFLKNGKPVYVAWWDYFNDGSYTPGKTIGVSLSGLSGTAGVITEAVPGYDTGAEVSDYETAFNKSTAIISDGTASLTLGDSPVFVETPSLSLVKKVTITNDSEGGSARPEIVATEDRVLVTYLGHTSGGFSTKTFDVKVFDKELSSLITFTTIVPPSAAFGTATDIRVAREGQNVYAFYETSTTSTTYLHGSKYTLNDGFDLAARAPEPIAASKPVFQMNEGDEVLNDPAPLVGADSVYVLTRLWSSITTTGNTVYRVREFSKDTMTQLNQFDLDLSDIADGRGRVTSLLYADSSIYMALATTVSDQGAGDTNKFSDDGAMCDILLIRMNRDWTFDPQTDVRTLSTEPNDRENYITGLKTDGAFFYLNYKQAVGSPPTGEQRAVIKVFDKDLKLVHKETVKSVVWSAGEIRPSLEIYGNRIYSGQDNSQSLGAGNGEVYVFEME